VYAQGPVCHDRAKIPIIDPKLLQSCREALTISSSSIKEERVSKDV